MNIAVFYLFNCIKNLYDIDKKKLCSVVSISKEK